MNDLTWIDGFELGEQHWDQGLKVSHPIARRLEDYDAKREAFNLLLKQEVAVDGHKDIVTACDE